ncbi:MAG: hypothetical protein H0W74_06210 [Sphingosinicella sp.]|nr:hypothetical protein [Sphingosinicella sp.]
MKHGLTLIVALLAGCAPVTHPVRPPGRSEKVRPGFDPARVRADLVKTARERFGAQMTDEALGSDAFLLIEHYQGLSLPPIVEPNGSYRYPDPPFAMLIRRDGQWMVAKSGRGFVALAPERAMALQAALRDRSFWRKPAYVAPECTDAGLSLLWLKIPRKPVLIRQGSCGGTKLGQRLIFLALDS